jgi:Glu-tRNA(Gln) amidotransferase subunit E-like FAD-binding protein
MDFDYKELELKVGLECHFQLDTPKKLFCNCNTKLIERKPDFIVKRYLRAVASELGEKDIVAEFEEAKNRYAIYEAYNNETCLVELDEEPPHAINKEALEVALQVCLMLNCKIPDLIQVMRKQVLDYSNTSGFQRSALVGYDGYIKTKNGKIGISSVYLEEDAARKINETNEYVIYRLDRLGIPLIEISTDPDINDPEQTREIAAQLGMILNSTGKIKNILGSIRQDVNLSINNGARTEVKGIQELGLIPLLIKNEVLRQFNIIQKGKKVENEVRMARRDGITTFLRPLPGKSRLYVETDVPQIIVTKELLNKIKIPELITDKINYLQKKHALSEELSNELIRQNIDFGFYSRRYNKISTGLLASLLISYNKEKNLENALNLLNSGKITKDIFDDIIKKGEIDLGERININEIEKEIKKIINEQPELSVNAVMGILMSKYKGKIQGNKLIELIKKFKE